MAGFAGREPLHYLVASYKVAGSYKGRRRSHFHGNEYWEFDDEGYIRWRDASINDYEIDESERKYCWER